MDKLWENNSVNNNFDIDFINQEYQRRKIFIIKEVNKLLYYQEAVMKDNLIDYIEWHLLDLNELSLSKEYPDTLEICKKSFSYLIETILKAGELKNILLSWWKKTKTYVLRKEIVMNWWYLLEKDTLELLLKDMEIPEYNVSNSSKNKKEKTTEKDEIDEEDDDLEWTIDLDEEEASKFCPFD